MIIKPQVQRTGGEWLAVISFSILVAQVPFPDGGSIIPCILKKGCQGRPVFPYVQAAAYPQNTIFFSCSPVVPARKQSIAGGRTDRGRCIGIGKNPAFFGQAVNGRSSYYPPLYNELKRRWQSEPLEQNIEDLQALGVKYLILHSSLYEEDSLDALMSNISRLEERIQFVTRKGEAYVYELAPPLQRAVEDVSLEQLKSIPNNEWSATSNVNSGNVKYVLDGDPSTRWHIGGRDFDVYFHFDLGRVYRLKGLSMNYGLNSAHCPKSYRIEVSTNGDEWFIVSQEENYLQRITTFVLPQNVSLDITFPPREVRYVKFINTDKNVDRRWWSIYEIEFFE